jgi:hypothetical protein
MTPLNWKGIWSVDTQYSIGDVVYYIDNGFTYVAIDNGYIYPPTYPNSNFILFAGFDISSIDGGEF